MKIRRQDERHRIALTPTMSRVYRGEDDLSQWDDEELQRGKKRNPDGRFYGQDPSVLPRAIVDELNRRAFDQANSIIREDVESAVRLWGSVVRDEAASTTDRLKASELIAERVLGKPVDRAQVEVSVRNAPWEDAIEVAVVGSVADVIDVEPEDDDWPEWDEGDA